MSTEQADATTDATTGSWQMWAGQRTNHGETAPVFVDVGDHPMYTKMHGHDEPLRVLVVEDVEGRYWGWLSNLNRDRNTAASYEETPSMIYEHEGIFDMCFPCGYKAEVKANAGRVVRLSITVLDDTTEPTTEPNTEPTTKPTTEDTP